MSYYEIAIFGGRTESSGISFLNTYPMSSERLETVNQLAVSKNYGAYN